MTWVVDYHSDAAQRNVRKLLKRHRPTALVASEGSITLGAFRAISSLALVCPSSPGSDRDHVPPCPS